MLSAAQRLRAIHCDIRGAHQQFDARPVLGRKRDPDRRANVDAVGGKLEGFRNRQNDSPCDPLDLVNGFELGEEDRKFIAGEAGKKGPSSGASGRSSGVRPETFTERLARGIAPEVAGSTPSQLPRGPATRRAAWASARPKG